jgi:hypothetical protein
MGKAVALAFKRINYEANKTFLIYITYLRDAFNEIVASCASLPIDCFHVACPSRMLSRHWKPRVPISPF